MPEEGPAELTSVAGQRAVRVERPALLDRIDPLRHTVLEASAGTGKTYTLEHLIVELVLEHGVPLERILVVTFTEKATREMRERVRATLRRVLDAAEQAQVGDAWVAGEQGLHSDALPGLHSDAIQSGDAVQSGETQPAEGPREKRVTDEAASEAGSRSTAWVIDGAARRRLEDALAVFDRAPISTIHGFCQRVLTESAFDCARLLTQEQVESRAAFSRAFREELRVQLAAEAPLRAVLERVLDTYPVARLEAVLFRWYLERGRPEPAFEHSRVAAAMARMPSRMELAPSGHAAMALARGLSRQPKKTVPALLAELAPIVERARAGAPLLEVLVDFWGWAAKPAPGKETALSYVHKYLSRARGLGPLADAARTLSECAGSPLVVLVTELLPRVVHRVSGRKAKAGEFDFDDMLSMLRDALSSDGGHALVADLRRRYQVALVDEFQDTDRIQWDIVRRVFFEPGSERSLVLIGDPKQAIYGFRNADVHTYHAAKEEVRQAGGDIIPLVTQYRSRREVIDAVNEVLSTGFFSGVNAYPHPVTCGLPQLRAFDDEGASAPALTLFHMVGKPTLRADRVRQALGERIAEEIRHLLSGGMRVEHGDGPVELTPSDIHVLCRSRTDADAVGRALAEAQLPFAFYKQEGLFQTPAARDIAVVLRAIQEPTARGKRLDAWLTPFFAVPLSRLLECRDVSPDHPLAAPLFRWRAMAEGQRWAALCRSLLEDSGLVRRELFASNAERALTDYGHILEVLLEETHRGHRSLPQLLARLGAFIEGRELPVGESGNVHRLESERRAVQVLTMHKSKGLEAEVVFLAGGLSEPPSDRFSPRVFHSPSGERCAWVGAPPAEVKARVERERREEAERLLYVALTRARSALYVPYFGPPPEGAEKKELSYELDEHVPRAAEASPPRDQLGLHLEEAARLRPPLVDEGTQYEMSRLHGPYRVLNERLVSLVRDGATGGAAINTPATNAAATNTTASDLATAEGARRDGPSMTRDVSEDPVIRLFRRVEVPVVGVRSADELGRTGLSGWRPPVSLRRLEDPHEGRFAALRLGRGGFDVTSYTRMKSALGGYRGPVAEGASEEALLADAVDAALPHEEELPGGAGMGVFLHEVLELVSFDDVRALDEETPGRAWREADKTFAELLGARARSNGIDARWLPDAADLVVAALRAPLSLADGGTLESGLCAASHRVAEMPFLHPIPEASIPSLDAGALSPDRPLMRIERGFIRGVIDLVFEHEGRYHVADYKSDRLPSYAPAEVEAHVERNYLVQARLYTLGTLRALGIHDRERYESTFGGLAYLFLRGMGPGGVGGPRDGVWTARPAWDDVLTWERTLYESSPWGYSLPSRR
ncbi:MAG: UvrD-helicase domain-containing protein [Sandaracinaceae bacterium]